MTHELLLDDVEEQLRNILAVRLKVDPERIQRGARMKDLGADSLDFLETIFDVESHFQIQFPDSESEIKDFDGLLALVERLVAKREG
jgi:acyl carrier protein